MSSKKFLELREDETNLESATAGHIKQIFDVKRMKHTDTFDHMFEVYQMHVKIHPMWQERDKATGYPKWQQAIRNIAKVHKRQRTPDPLTQGELMALKKGGFALPRHVPPGRKVVKFPDLGGFDVPIVKKKKKAGKGDGVSIFKRRGDNTYSYIKQEHAALAQICEDSFVVLEYPERADILTVLELRHEQLNNHEQKESRKKRGRTDEE